MDRSADPRALSALATRKDTAIRDKFSWDMLRLLLALAEAGSFRSAAVDAGVSLNTIRSKIDQLERRFAAPLLIRSVEGVRLTQEGYELVAIAREMAALGRSSTRVRSQGDRAANARLRVEANDALGAFWLARCVVDGSSDIAPLSIELGERAPDVLFRDVDLVIGTQPVSGTDVASERVGTVHVMPFASATYLRTHDPVSPDTVKRHRLVVQDDNPLVGSAISDALGTSSSGPTIAVRTNGTAALYQAVAGGAGVGFLPSFFAALDPALRPVDLGLQFAREVIVVHHAAHDRRVADALSWVRACFDGTRYPWFANSFIHPDEFCDRLSDPALAQSFAGLANAR